MISELKLLDPKEHPDKVIELADAIIEDSKQCYGFISSRWKPLAVTHGWVYGMREEARIELKHKLENRK